MKTVTEKSVESETKTICFVAWVEDVGLDSEGDIVEINTAALIEELAANCGVNLAMIRTLEVNLDSARHANQADLEDLHFRLERLEKARPVSGGLSTFLLRAWREWKMSAFD